MTKPKADVSIKMIDNKWEVRWGWQTMVRKTESGRLACWIPGFDVYFSVRQWDDVPRKAIGMMKMYMDHFMLHKGEPGTIKNLTLHLHRLGFKAPDDFIVMNKARKNKPVDTTFSTGDIQIPEMYANAKVHQHQEAELEVAATA